MVQEESQVCHVVDPLGGSYYVEALTGSIIEEAQKIIDEVEELGGMAKAIETGMPKMRIEESAARKQARIDQGWMSSWGSTSTRSRKTPTWMSWKFRQRQGRAGGPIEGDQGHP
jgi:methylmalonyl-CoA mutase N-terminal domain/subunit